MASWNLPDVLSTILGDVPVIRTLLNALLRQDPEGTKDLPAGAKRWTDTASGKQFQVFNGSEWQSVGKLDHDAASVDGFSASQTVQANSIAVRDKDGRIPGDLLGNAATASTAEKLSEPNPVSLGGTGATTPAEAREALNVPPKAHASTTAEYGLASATEYGHAMPSSSLPLADAAEGAVGADEAHFARADHQHPVTMATADVAGAVTLTDDPEVDSGAESSVAVSSKALNKAVNAAKGALPVGWKYFRPMGRNPYPGGLDFLGQEVTRAMYADLWAWENEHNPDTVISEERWQELYASQNGNVPYYSTGDGETTFRLPRIVAYAKGAGSVDEVGQYEKEGAPNIDGGFQTIRFDSQNGYRGAFFPGGTTIANINQNVTIGGGETVGWYDFEASLCSSVYRDDVSHITPETIVGVYGVIAISVPGVLAEADKEGIITELAAHSADIESKVSKSGDSIEYLDLPVGALRANKDPNYESLDMEGYKDGTNGAVIGLRTNNAQHEPGSIALLSRRADGSFGASVTVERERLLTNGIIAVAPTGCIVPQATADLRELLFVANDVTGELGGILALRTKTDPGMPGGFVLQANGPGGTHNLHGDSHGTLAWQGRVLAREHNLFVNLGGYIYGSGGVWFSGLNDQTIGISTAITHCDCNCDCDCGGY